jgi:hypothetical protein
MTLIELDKKLKRWTDGVRFSVNNWSLIINRLRKDELGLSVRAFQRLSLYVASIKK